MTTDEKIKNIENFLKNAWCINGECTFQAFDNLLSRDGTQIPTMTFLLKDGGDSFKVSITENLF
jgi:hypothetical protein